eukprot:TRINITY_DN5719_c0_g1_i1.p1 TRINITY_DN5719_c0_g1~~TRINITY_DN5719_c0_g1_i1.p1  ORF type:complete len:214 (-),score=41.33 TRINITY_DN5719_c0_g1_i1:337-978(-)
MEAMEAVEDESAAHSHRMECSAVEISHLTCAVQLGRKRRAPEDWQVVARGSFLDPMGGGGSEGGAASSAHGAAGACSENARGCEHGTGARKGHGSGEAETERGGKRRCMSDADGGPVCPICHRTPARASDLSRDTTCTLCGFYAGCCECWPSRGCFCAGECELFFCHECPMLRCALCCYMKCDACGGFREVEPGVWLCVQCIREAAAARDPSG